jgi:hypothetical protein
MTGTTASLTSCPSRGTSTGVTAASQIAGLVSALVPTAQVVQIIHRGPHLLWDTLVDRLAGAGLRVRREELPEDDRRWSIPESEDGRPDVMIYHDPFGGTEAVDVQAVRAAATTALVVVDFPHGISGTELRNRLEQCYLDALSQPWWQVEARSRALAAVLEQAREAVLTHGADRLVIAAPWTVRTDLMSFERDLPIVQLPLGEAWLAVSSHSVNGTVSLAVGAGSVTRVEVRAGRPVTSVPCWHPDDAIAEVGFGRNTASRRLVGTTLEEKAWESIHLGMGDNSLLGGEQIGSRHWDIGLAPSTVVDVRWAEGGPARVPRVGGALGWMLVAGSGAALPGASTTGPVISHSLEPIAVVGGCQPTEESLVGRRLLAPGTPVHVLGDFEDDRIVSNLEALNRLGSLTAADVVVLPASDVPSSTVAEFALTGDGSGLAVESDLDGAWRLLRETFGQLPWPRVRVVSIARSWPRALSFPGIVFLSRSLESTPLTMRWLYLVHELVHQWLGNTILVNDDGREVSELLVEAIAAGVARDVLGGASAGVLAAQAHRYGASAAPDLRARGRVLTEWAGSQQRIRRLRARAGWLIREGRDGFDRNGARTIVPRYRLDAILRGDTC